MKIRLRQFFYLRTFLVIHYSLFIIHYSFSQFIITTSATPVTCPGGNNGTAAVSVAGGSPPYTYLWSNGATGATALTLTAGSYSVTIKDNTGINDSTVIIPVQQPSPISDNADIRQPFCISIGHIILLPTGGTSPYFLNWNDGSTNFFINAGPGNYSVIITDANNCTTGFSYTLAEEECFVTPSSYFTPNGDEINDTWIIANSQYFPNAKVIVFNRWGTKVWEHKGLYEPWDGKSYLGIPVPDAVYYYFFFQDKDDKQKEAKRGSLTILR